MSTQPESTDWFGQPASTSASSPEPPAAPLIPPAPASELAGDPTGVSAIVHTSDGWPVPAAVLTVTDVTGQQVARVGADADGRLATKPLPVGTYTAILTAPGFEPTARAALVTASGADLGTVDLARVADAELPPQGVYTIDPVHSAINVTARHLGFATVRGRFTEFSGKIEVGSPVEQSRVTALIEAASIDTGNKMRDDHMRSADFMSVDVHPVIQYVGTSITPLGGEKWRVDGKLTLNGMTRPISLDLTYLGVGPDSWGGLRAAFHAVTDLKREDFAMNFNQMVRAGVAAVGTTLRVELDIEALQGDTLPSF